MKKCKGKSNLSIVQDYLDGVRPFTEISMHISEDKKHRNEGEKWTDTKGIQWQKLNGKIVRLTKTQGDVIREAIGDGLDCKVCGAKWKWIGTRDRKMMARTGLCADCLIDYENKLRILGIYEIYEKCRMAMYELGHLKELKLKIKETIDYLERTDGDIHKLAESEYDENVVWKNTNKEKMLEDAKADLIKTEDFISKGIPITKDFQTQYSEAISKFDLPNILG